MFVKDRDKQIDSLRIKITKLQEKKKKCKSFYDEVLCVSRLNQMIADTRERIKTIKKS